MMTSEELLPLLSDNHRHLIRGDGIICLLSLSLSFSLAALAVPYRNLWYFLWYNQGYGERYPHLFLVFGGLFVLMSSN